MGATNGRDARRMRQNVARLEGKLKAGRILTAAQHEYLDDLKKSPKHGLKRLRNGGHRCPMCGTGGHRRTGGVQKSPNGAPVRV